MVSKRAGEGGVDDSDTAGLINEKVSGSQWSVSCGMLARRTVALNTSEISGPSF